MEDNRDFTPHTSIDLTRTAGPIPEGVHRFRVVACEEKEGPSGPYWNLTCEVVGEQQYEGQRVWHTVSLVPAARWKLEEFLDAINAPESGAMDGNDTLGAFFMGQVFHDEYEGVKRPKIKKCLPAEGGAPVGQPTQQRLSLGNLSARPRKDKKALPEDVTEE